jgi:hypothetical protein
MKLSEPRSRRVPYQLSEPKLSRVPSMMSEPNPERVPLDVSELVLWRGAKKEMHERYTGTT